MLAIRMQRTGRHGHAMFRMIVQDSRRTPTSGNIVALLGNYDPHAKTATFDKEKASYYLEHGAQPSDRVIFLLKSQGVKLPSWVETENKKTATIRHADKLRRNRPPEAAPAPEAVQVESDSEADTASPVEEVTETPTLEPTATAVEPTSVEEPAVAETEEVVDAVVETPDETTPSTEVPVEK